jgi:2-dehydro-3-deoxyglucarate aldolase
MTEQTMHTTQSIRETMQRGLPSVGTWLQLPSADVAEILGAAGYQWVAADLEHGAFSRSQLPDVFRAVSLGGTAPFARVAHCDMTGIKSALDSGAQGLIFPMIETRAQLDEAISWALYPPAGTRGVGFCRGNLYGRNFDHGMAQAAETVFVAQIEHIRAVENIDDILSHPRLDAIMVGPYDLSGSMDCTGDFAHPQFTAALARIESAAKARQIPMGLHIVSPDPAELARRTAQGYRFIAYGLDAVFLWNAAQNPAAAPR